MTRNPDFVPLTESMDAVIRGLRPQEASAAAVAPRALGGVFGRWEEIVGELIAANTQPVRLEGDTLTVEVSEPAWVPQLRFFEATILERLAETVGGGIARLNVRVARDGALRRAPRSRG